MKTYEIEAAGHVIPLAYNMMVFEIIEQVDWPVEPDEDGNLPLSGWARMIKAWTTPATRLQTALNLVVIMGNYALRQQGKKGLLTFDWVSEHLMPGQMGAVQEVLKTIFDEGNALDASVTVDEDEDVDEVLAELDAKKAEAVG